MAIRERDGVYFLDYYDPDGRRVRKSVGTNKDLAETAMKKIDVAIAEGRYLDMKKEDDMTIDEALADFLVYSKNNKISYVEDVRMSKTIAAFFGGMRIADITPAFIEKFKAARIASKNRLGGPIQPATVNVELAMAKAAVNWAIRNGKTEKNPFSRVKMLKTDNEIVRYLDEDEMRRLTAACPPVLKRVVLTALNTAMRREEIMSMKWEQVNMDQRVILLTKTKSGKRREIPVNDQLMEVLRVLHSIGPNGKTDCVFVRDDGTRYWTWTMEKDFALARTAAEVKKFRFHDLRHTAASYLAMNGVDPFTLRDILGHSTLRMVERYVHLFPKHKRKAMETLGNVIAPFIAGTSPAAGAVVVALLFLLLAV